MDMHPGPMFLMGMLSGVFLASMLVVPLWLVCFEIAVLSAGMILFYTRDGVRS